KSVIQRTRILYNNNNNNNHNKNNNEVIIIVIYIPQKQEFSPSHDLLMREDPVINGQKAGGKRVCLSHAIFAGPGPFGPLTTHLGSTTPCFNSTIMTSYSTAVLRAFGLLPTTDGVNNDNDQT